MTEQKIIIKQSAQYIRDNSPFKKMPALAVLVYSDSSLIKEFNPIKKISYSDIPPVFASENKNRGELIFARSKKGKQDILILNGFMNYYDGYKMREAAHPVYVLNELGIKNLVIIDEVGYLNPRFKIGGTAVIYDHINLMGDNPLIGENDNSIGTRFPDMSEPYDEKWYNKNTAMLRNNKFEFYPAVYLGITGPETETEAECRFYRETGSDVLGYSLVPLNIAAVHAGLKCSAFGMITRELVADRLREIPDEEKSANRRKAEKAFAPMLVEIINSLK